MSDPLADLEALLAGMGEVEKVELDKLLENELKAPFLPNPGPQTEAMRSEADLLLYGGQAGGGKGLALDTPLPTPSGWATMGTVSVGDQLFDADGNVCFVTAVSQISNRPCYRMVFDDGTEIVADDVHRWITFDAKELGRLTKSDPLWMAARRARRPSRATGNKSAAFMAAIAKANATRVPAGPPPTGSMRDTLEISQTLTVRDGSRKNHAIEVNGGIKLPHADLPIYPYTLGAWLGDGTSANAGFTSADDEILEAIRADGYDVKKRNSLSTYSYGILGLQKTLRLEGLLGNKHVPDVYLRASYEQRLAVVQGLMDTDGTCSSNGGCEFDNTNYALIVGMSELLASLGIKFSVMPRRAKLYGKDCGPSWRIGFNTSVPVFRLNRKLDRMRKPRRTTQFRYVVSCDEIPSVPTKCISVDSPSRMFLAGFSMVPTHNSALEVGCFFDNHYSGTIFRREGTQLEGLIDFCKQIGEPSHGRFVGGNENVFKRNDGGRLRFAGLKEPDDWRKHAGNAKDFMAFDEAGEFLREQVMNLIGWLRSTRKGQRCRVILGSNPPRGGDGEWLIEEFSPWLDPLYVNPAKPGELRWAIVVAGVTEWVAGPGEHIRGGEPYEAMSRTFIPASLNDNPYLKDTNYKAKLQALPEPLRSQLLYGNFLAGRIDHEWQVIPTEWVRMANDRWLKAPQAKRQMVALSTDVALSMAGDDNVIARLHTDCWFDRPVRFKGGSLVEADQQELIPLEIANMILKNRKDGADVSIDGSGGWASGVRASLKKDHEVTCYPIVFSAPSNARTRDGLLSYANVRAQAYYQFREALDPEHGDDIMLPPDPRLTAQLTVARYKVRGMKIQVEEKAEIKKRIGSSPDDADAYVQVWLRRNAALRAIAAKAKPKTKHTHSAPSADGWMT